MEKYKHGGDVYSNKVRYDFSSNINPLGMAEEVRQVVFDNLEMCEKYPDTECDALREAISIKENVHKDEIVCGNGSIDILYRLLHVLKPKNSLIAVPCFSEYEKALIECGSSITKYYRKEDTNFRIKSDIFDYLEGKDVIILCQPNNPDGSLIDKDIMEKIIDIIRNKDIMLIVDECFMDFVEEKFYNTIKYGDNIFVLKAFTKIYAIPGLRLGYGICYDKRLINAVKEYGPEWSVSSIAQIAGIASLKLGEGYLSNVSEYVRNEREYLKSNLKSLGIKVYDGNANFLLIKYKNKELYNKLLDKGILIRKCDNYDGLGERYYRIAVRTHKENIELIKQLTWIGEK